jgi:DNA helicase-2/ATP-dependent DNA helicase PcrA
MRELSAVLAAHSAGAGYVVAPAGYGKTYLIAEATARSAGRQLVLTHTYAGVNALRNKMRMLGVSERLYHIDTIAGWALRVCISYSGKSGWKTKRPDGNDQWSALYEACTRLLDWQFMRRIIRASYAGLYVDEYQDCSTAQHSIVVRLSRDLPTRILGDPLQGIFDFEGQASVDWERDVAGAFTLLGQLIVPYRWIRAGAAKLGDWLSVVRARLEAEQPIDLSNNLPSEVTFRCADNARALFQAQGNTCRYFNCDRQHTVIAIHKGSKEYKAKCHRLARNLSGRFSSIEEIEGKELFSFIAKIGRAGTGAARLKEVIELAKRCMTAVEDNLPAATTRGEHVVIRANTRNPEAAQRANDYLAQPGSAEMAKFLMALRNTPNVEVVRLDLFNRVIGVLRKHILHAELSFAEAAEKYHGEFRYRGRPIGRRKLIGTTLLVKGLEFDHAIVLDAPSLSKKELYVAFTRGARSLTIVSTSPRLRPRD